MPINVKTLNWPTLIKDPNRVNEQLTWTAQQLKQHPTQFETNYQILLKLKTLQGIQLADQLDDRWFKLIQTMTNTNRKYYFGASYPNYEGEIIDTVQTWLTQIQKTLLKPNGFVDVSYPTYNIDQFTFTFDLIEDLNDFHYQWDQIKHWTNAQLLAPQSSFSIEQFALKLVKIRHWQLEIQQTINHSYLELSNQPDPQFEKLIKINYLKR